MSDFFDDELFAKVDGLVAQLEDRYLEWTSAELGSLRVLIAEARNTPQHDRSQVGIRIFAVSHDIKGQGSSFNYVLMTELGNRLCRFVETRPILDDDALDQVSRFADAMEWVIENRQSGDGGEAGQELRDWLDE